ncbi:ketosteroid isomerase [Paramesorhizobium deserti]|uniref:Ketosteroid isomerase n=1 Tax=Paramesorhizobium deserti TaxID=1494590 RepID=A0A135HP15_9HYPH|nr:nuclear transport factor 2 family protein [Paramesorhizobium deserti]KXF74955.1 ketosteroid isomerase [Paramesorhizobium deserti]
MTTTESEVRAVLESRVEACRAKDIDRLMSLYSPDIVYFDVVPPLYFSGTDAVRNNFLRWFNEYEGPIGLETRELNIVASENAAFARMLHQDMGNANLTEKQKGFWLRSTVCCERSDGGWWITHEHISLPVDFRSGSVLMNLAP